MLLRSTTTLLLPLLLEPSCVLASLKRAECGSGQTPISWRRSRQEASPLPDLNRRPLPYHGSALPTELRGRSTRVSLSDVDSGSDDVTRTSDQASRPAPSAHARSTGESSRPENRSCFHRLNQSPGRCTAAPGVREDRSTTLAQVVAADSMTHPEVMPA